MSDLLGLFEMKDSHENYCYRKIRNSSKYYYIATRREILFWLEVTRMTTANHRFRGNLSIYVEKCFQADNLKIFFIKDNWLIKTYMYRKKCRYLTGKANRGHCINALWIDLINAWAKLIKCLEWNIEKELWTVWSSLNEEIDEPE